MNQRLMFLSHMFPRQLTTCTSKQVNEGKLCSETMAFYGSPRGVCKGLSDIYVTPKNPINKILVN